MGIDRSTSQEGEGDPRHTPAVQRETRQYDEWVGLRPQERLPRSTFPVETGRLLRLEEVNLDAARPSLPVDGRGLIAAVPLRRKEGRVDDQL